MVTSDLKGQVILSNSILAFFSSSKTHSGVIFNDTGVTQIFSNNTVIGDSGAYSPFEIYCKAKHLEPHQAIKELKKLDKKLA